MRGAPNPDSPRPVRSGRARRGAGAAVRRLLAVLAVAALAPLACTSGKATGTRFEPLAPPDALSSLVYVYRLDEVKGVDAARVKLDGDDLTKMRNTEYLALVVDPGVHEISTGLMWLGLLARSWNALDFEARAGETIYVKLWAATAELPPPPADAEAAGRSDRRADVALFMARVDRATAEAELTGTRRADLR